VSDVAALQALFEPFNRSDAPGLVVGVAQHGRPLYSAALGLASVQHQVANTLATCMRIGSTTKHFTCLAALLLAEEGKLDLDAPATRWLPELPTDQAVPTLRQFMTHTSGYRCGLALSLLANGHTLQPPGWDLAALARQQERNFAPGEDQSYCNGGYHLLSIAIERVSGVPLAAFLRSRIFEPMGMHDTALVPSDHVCVPGLAAPHLPLPSGGWRRGFFPSDEVLGEGGMVSTVHDMQRWLAHLRAPERIVSAESWRQMFEPARLANGYATSYSLGLMHHHYRGVQVLHHAGGVIGGNSQMLTVPAHALDINIMVNGAAANASELAWQVLDVLLADHLGPPPAPLQSAAWLHLLGATYAGDEGVQLAFVDFGGRLALSLQHAMPSPGAVLREQGDQIICDAAAITRIHFNRAALVAGSDGQAPERLVMRRCGQQVELHRLGAVPSPNEIAPRLIGRYHSHDLAADAQIDFSDKVLTLRMRGEFSAWRSFKVEALSLTRCTLIDEGLLPRRLTLDIEPGVEPVHCFRLDDPRARRLKFVRVQA
jgi:D-aminopeptidase